MATLTVKNGSGADAGSVDLAPEVFEKEPNLVLIRELYTATMANARQGTHKTKTRGEVRGGGKKPWKQKGTGRARAGSTRSPIWVGGGTIFGPMPRSYREKVNKKKRQAAFRSYFAAKLQDSQDESKKDQFIIIDDISLSDPPKTKDAVAFLNAIGATGKTLIVTKEKNGALVRAARNLEGSSQTPTRIAIASALSIVDLLRCDTLVMTKDALADIQERLK